MSIENGPVSPTSASPSGSSGGGVTETPPPSRVPTPAHADVVPLDISQELLALSGALLAIVVGVYAFVPLIIDLAVQRSVDADLAAVRAQRAGRSFDILLASVLTLGLSTGLGLLVIYVRMYAIYIAQAVLLGVGLVALLTGILGLGWTLRAVRRG